MKNPSTILPHIFSNKPRFFTQKCLQKLTTLLPKRFAEHLHYMYLKNRTLYLVFDHPAFVMELNYSKKDINALLKMLRENYGFCRDIDVRTVKGYHKFIPAHQSETPSILRYSERAKGEFPNYATSEKTKALIEKIKEAIRRNAAGR